MSDVDNPVLDIEEDSNSEDEVEIKESDVEDVEDVDDVDDVEDVEDVEEVEDVEDVEEVEEVEEAEDVEAEDVEVEEVEEVAHEEVEDNPIVPIYEDGEADMDFKQGEEEVQEDISEINIVPEDLLNQQILVIYFQHDKYKDFLGHVFQIDKEFYFLKNKGEELLKILLNKKYTSDGSQVYEFIKIKEVELETFLDEKDIFKEKDIELDLEVVEEQFKKYNEYEIKEDFISEIINLYNIYDDELLIKKITEMAYSFFELIKENKLISDIDRTDALSFVKNMINNNDFELPKFIIPIVALKKKIYQDGDDIFVEKIDTLISSTEVELVEKYTKMNTDDAGYFKDLNILFEVKYNSYISDNDKLGFELNYSGNIIRDCLNDTNSCNGIDDKKYIIDLLRARNDLSVINDDEKTIYIDKDILNIIGLLFLPENLIKYGFNISLKNSHFNLHENILLFNKSKFIKSFGHNFKNNEMISKKINLGTVKDEYTNNLLAYMFDLQENINLDKLAELLNNTLPTNKSILDSVSKKLLKNIYNINDFEKLLILYNISINDLLYEDKNGVIDLIKKNISNYEKQYKKLLKPKPLKKFKLITKELDITAKIKISLEYIFKNRNIVVKNNLLTKFMKIYCREANSDLEDNNWLYSTKTNVKVLCKHYYYSSKIDKHPEYYDTLKSIFCPESEDGNVCCKICGHFIDSVDFSTFMGYSDGQVIQMNELMEDEEISDISEDKKEIKDKIKNISKIFNIKLYPKDLESIVSIVDIIDDEKFINYRYEETNYIKTCNYSKFILEKYPLNKKSKDKSVIQENKKNQKKHKRYGIKFSKYLKKINELLSISFLIFIHVQISDETYKMNLNDMYNVLIHDEEESWKNLNISNDDQSINKKMLQYLEIKLDEIFENARGELEHTESLDQFHFHDQFIKTIRYLMSPQFNLYSKINKYFTLNKGYGELYTKESWPSYKPLYDNKLVLDINNYISSKDEEFKEYFMNNDSLENISLLKDINKIEPKYVELKLPISDIMSNPSYKRLYMYALKLYNKSEVFPMLNLLASKFLNDMKDDKITELLTKSHYNNNKFTKIDYNDLKKFLIGDITRYEISKTNDKDNITKFKHINLNNTEYLLLNCTVKGFYKYEPAVIFVDSPYEELIENNDSFMNKLFNNYCLDKDGNLIENLLNENVLNYYLVDYNVELKENLSECKKTEIPKSNENFKLIMSYLSNKNKLKFNPLNYIKFTEKYTNEEIHEYLNFNTTIENRLLRLFEENNYLKNDDDQIFEKIQEIINYIKEHKSKNEKIDDDHISNQIDDLIPSMKIKEKEYFENINGLFNIILKDDEYITKFNPLQIKRLKDMKITNLHNIEHSSILLEKLTEDIDDGYIYKRFIDDIYFTISRLKNKYNNYTDIRKNIYKLTDTNVEEFNKYININEFLLHDDLFFKRNKKDLDDNIKYNGFKQYKDEDNINYFEGLYNHINKYNINLVKLRGAQNNILGPELLLKINRFVFVFIINKMTEYITGLFGRAGGKEQFICLSRFLLDLIMNLYEKYYDINWIYINNDILNKSIMKQTSREKQNYLNKITNMSKELKLLNDLKNDIGQGTLYKESEKENAKFAMSTEWEDTAINEKSDYQKEILMSVDDGITEERFVQQQEVTGDTGYDQYLYDQEENDESNENDF